MNSLDKARAILAKCLFIPEESILPEADISSLGKIDSLTFELIVLEVENVSGRDIDPVRLLEMRSVGDLARLLDR
ncbi:acyl carrier protein [Ochrobactrum sp. Q0168]|uniref:acyl carrier protein n=1 Tax=Ochrobactrum sp. Q0168 TaxID=2793241 RepID=UPI0018ED2491|nr:acyl carrier protein [Ochrobactrum sp. Q0168]